MTKSLRWTYLRVVLFAAVLGLIAAGGWWISQFESLLGIFLAATGNHDTIYAPGYAEDGFRSLRIRMSAAQVEAIMGPPLAKRANSDDGNVSIWEYSQSPSDSDFWKRWLVMRGGRIEKICNLFYED